MTNENPMGETRRIEGNNIAFNSQNLSRPQISNHINVAIVNGNIYLDFGYLEYLTQINKLDATISTSAEIVARVCLSDETATQLLNTLQQAKQAMAKHRSEAMQIVPEGTDV